MIPLMTCLVNRFYPPFFIISISVLLLMLLKMEVIYMQKNDITKYSAQLAMLKKLLVLKLITDKEYTQIKNKLMQDYKIVSNITI